MTKNVLLRLVVTMQVGWDMGSMLNVLFSKAGRSIHS
jgi:hypothetical protein